jgi:hypothetical protein
MPNSSKLAASSISLLQDIFDENQCIAGPATSQLCTLVDRKLISYTNG